MAWSEAARRAAALARKRRAKAAKYVVKTPPREYSIRDSSGTHRVKSSGGFMTRVPGHTAAYGFKSFRHALNDVRLKRKR